MELKKTDRSTWILVYDGEDSPVRREDWAETTLQQVCEQNGFATWRMRGDDDSRYPEFYEKSPGGRPNVGRKAYQHRHTVAEEAAYKEWITQYRQRQQQR